MPFLKSIRSIDYAADVEKYPFNIPAFSDGINMEFTSNVTFFVEKMDPENQPCSRLSPKIADSMFQVETGTIIINTIRPNPLLDRN